jgi:hypothetical protein
MEEGALNMNGDSISNPFNAFHHHLHLAWASLEVICDEWTPGKEYSSLDAFVADFLGYYQRNTKEVLPTLFIPMARSILGKKYPLFLRR